MGSLLSPFGSICCCTTCQQDPDCNYEEGRRKILQYAQHNLQQTDDIRIIEKYIEVPDGHLLFTKCYMPLTQKPKGCVFFIEGYATNLEYMDIHENCLFFAENGYIAIAHDHLGYGRSDGLWLYIPNTFDIDYVDNAHFIHNYCKDLYIKHLTSKTQHNQLYDYHDPSLFNNYFTKNMDDNDHKTATNEEESDHKLIPWTDLSYIDKANKYFLCGRSMGGAVATRLAMKYPASYRGLMLLCPMIAIDDTVKPPKWITYIFKWLAAWFPKKRWSPTKDLHPWMVSTKSGLNKMNYQPVKYGKPAPLKTAYELLNITERIEEDMHLLKMDFIVLHGLEDKVTSPKKSQLLYDHRKEECDATIKLYDKSMHLMWWEPCADQMYSDMLVWLNGKCQ